MSVATDTLHAMSAQSLIALTLFVSDVDASADFYRAIGCDVFECAEPGYPRHFDAATRNTVIQLFPAGDHNPASHNQIGIRVTRIEDASKALDDIGAGWTSPGPKRLSAKDPDGNVVQITEEH